MRGLLWLALFEVLGVLVLVWGIPRARRHLFPWKWRVGILALGLSFIFWPPLCRRYADATNGIVFFFAVVFSFGWSLGQLRQADRIHFF